MNKGLPRIYASAVLLWALATPAWAQEQLETAPPAEPVEEQLVSAAAAPGLASPVIQALAGLELLQGEAEPSARFFIYLHSAKWCSACREALSELQAAYDDLQAAGVEVIVVSADLNREEALSQLEPYPFPCVYGKAAADALPGFQSSGSLPWMCIVDSQGTTLHQGEAQALFPEWRSIIAEAEEGAHPMEDEEPVAASAPPCAASVAEALAALRIFNAAPDVEADYYVYLESAGWCAPCRAEMPEIVQAYREMKNSPARVEILLISSDASEKSAQEYLDSFEADFPAVHEQDPALLALPGYKPASGIPHATFVDANGRVVKTGHGSIIRHWKSIISPQ